MSTRTRTRPAIPSIIPMGNYTHVTRRNSDGVLLENLSGTSPLFTSPPAYDTTEVMTDEEVLLKRSGYCSHVRTSFNWLVPDYVVRTYPSYSGTATTTQTWFRGYWLWQRFRLNALTWLGSIPAAKAVDWDELSYQAMTEMQPSFVGGLSLINDLLELHQIKGLIDPFRRQRTSRDELRRRSNRRFAAETHLWWQFGIKPLISTITQVLDLLRKLPAVVRKLIERSDKIETRHFSRNIDHVSSFLADGQVYTDGGNPAFRVDRETRWVKPPKYHATLRFQVDIGRLQELEVYVKAVCEAIGLNRPFSILWNAIPYSFVVDWFTNVGEFVDSLLSEPVFPIVIKDFCHSVTWSYKTILYGHDNLQSGRTRAISRLTRVYERRTGPPCLVAKLHLKAPSITNVITGAALIVAGASKWKTAKKPRRVPWLNYGKVPGSQTRYKSR